MAKKYPFKENKKQQSFSKIIVLFVLFNGIAMLWASYILAAKDKIQIAESLSQIIATAIVATCVAYFTKAGIENLSKNNSWPDKQNQKNLKDLIEIACEPTVEEIEGGLKK